MEEDDPCLLRRDPSHNTWFYTWYGSCVGACFEKNRKKKTEFRPTFVVRTVVVLGEHCSATGFSCVKKATMLLIVFFVTAVCISHFPAGRVHRKCTQRTAVPFGRRLRWSSVVRRRHDFDTAFASALDCVPVSVHEVYSMPTPRARLPGRVTIDKLIQSGWRQVFMAGGRCSHGMMWYPSRYRRWKKKNQCLWLCK